jgi:hypothetical protein
MTMNNRSLVRRYVSSTDTAQLKDDKSLQSLKAQWEEDIEL